MTSDATEEDRSKSKEADVLKPTSDGMEQDKSKSKEQDVVKIPSDGIEADKSESKGQQKSQCIKKSKEEIEKEKLERARAREEKANEMTRMIHEIERELLLQGRDQMMYQ